ncbi:MAG: rhamnan synthesis F [Lachnospiraceae bacterium]|nr:rhamnan synthesis F [Lachnospiraceae bacterium]
MNRLAIYVFWEKEGIVRNYVLTYLAGLKEIAEKIYVVVNGKITSAGKDTIQKMGISVIVRENIGVDFWAYKTGLDAEGGLDKYDEIILANCSCYGPVYPFSEMFKKMDKSSVDFWGITEWPLNEAGYTGTWILSYFMVFRKRIFLSEDWNSWWDNLCPVYSREECIDKHEIPFTKFFADRNYSYDVYCPNTTDFIDSTIEAPDYLVINQKCPLIKRKAFCTEYIRFLDYHRGNASKRVFDYIKEHHLYNVNDILDDLLATQHYAHIKNCLHFNFFLPSDYEIGKLENPPKVAICFHVYYEDLLEHCFQYMRGIPDYIDIYITTPKESLISEIQKNIDYYQIHNAKVNLINARGRAESAFLVACKDFILNYDYACILHDKKSSFLRPGILGKEFGFHNQDALVKTKEYINNIIYTFEKNPRLGILEPINLLYGSFQKLYGDEWGPNFLEAKEFLHRAQIDLPIAQDVPPIFPAGAMFWFRPECMKLLIDMDWKYEDFPEEPLPLDGSLIHIIERAYPFVAQHAGYLIGWVSDIEDAEIHLTNVSYLYRDRNIKLEETRLKLKEVHTELEEAKNNVTVIHTGLNYALRAYIYKHLPRPVKYLFSKNKEKI